MDRYSGLAAACAHGGQRNIARTVARLQRSSTAPTARAGQLALCLALHLALTGQVASAAGERAREAPVAAAVGPGPADVLLDALTDDHLRDLVSEVLERNPEIARARQQAAAAAVRAPQVKALPDPVASLTIFALPPETRAGPQRLNAAFRQRFPWFGKLALREQAALHHAASAQAEVESQRLRLLTETRRRYYELAFFHQHHAIVSEERENLVRHEEVARARYSAGMGLQQEVLRIQADITRAEARLLEITTRSHGILVALNRLRDRPANLEVPVAPLPRPTRISWQAEDLRRHAGLRRPELTAIRAEIARREVLAELAGKAIYPDLTVGLDFTLVDRRQDDPGRLAPPPDNGDDILSFSIDAHLPVWKRKLEAGIEEALRQQAAAEASRRQIHAEIESRIGHAVAHLPLLFEQWQLFEEVLLAQAEEASSSAEAAYTTGKLNALDLLDSEHVLFQVRTSAIRTLTDHAIATAELERVIAGPLSGLATVPPTEAEPEIRDEH